MTGLPAGVACIYVELVAVTEFIPIDEEYFYIGTSNDNRLSVEEFHLFSQAIKENKVQQKIHGHEHKIESIDDGSIPVNGFKQDVKNFFSRYIIPLLKTATRNVIRDTIPGALPVLDSIPFTNKFINGKKKKKRNKNNIEKT